MFKTDKNSLSELSFQVSEEGITHLKPFFEYLRSHELSTLAPGDIETALQGLDAIATLKMQGRVYAFHVDDAYAAEQSGSGEGVELYLRQGDLLQEFFVPLSRDFVYQADRAAAFLKKQDISAIYTGQIPAGEDFLGLPERCDEDDPVLVTMLKQHEVETFDAQGIKVVMLEYLV